MAKILITEKQAQQFNHMRSALITIHREYQTPNQLRLRSEKEYGLDYEEALGMAYENIQGIAQHAVKGVKAIVINKPVNPIENDISENKS